LEVVVVVVVVADLPSGVEKAGVVAGLPLEKVVAL
jgi:hypothetical protein